MQIITQRLLNTYFIFVLQRIYPFTFFFLYINFATYTHIKSFIFSKHKTWYLTLSFNVALDFEFLSLHKWIIHIFIVWMNSHFYRCFNSRPIIFYYLPMNCSSINNKHTSVLIQYHHFFSLKFSLLHSAFDVLHIDVCRIIHWKYWYTFLKFKMHFSQQIANFLCVVEFFCSQIIYCQIKRFVVA